MAAPEWHSTMGSQVTTVAEYLDGLETVASTPVDSFIEQYERSHTGRG